MLKESQDIYENVLYETFNTKTALEEASRATIVQENLT